MSAISFYLRTLYDQHCYPRLFVAFLKPSIADHTFPRPCFVISIIAIFEASGNDLGLC